MDIMKQIKVNKENIQDALNLAQGVYAPLEGFLYSRDFYSVLENMRLADGKLWSIPIVLDIDKEAAWFLKNEKTVKIVNEATGSEAVLDNIEVYNFDKNEMASQVFGTLNEAHPGVAEVMAKGDYLVGGKVVEFKQGEKIFPQYHFSPRETREMFKKKGWKKIVAFQTRNVPTWDMNFYKKKP